MAGKGTNNTIKIKLSPFWIDSHLSWFAQAEAQFLICDITMDSLKNSYVYASLPKYALQTLMEALVDDRRNNYGNLYYRELKELILTRIPLIIERRTQELLSGEQMDDKRPSDFFRTLKSLAGTTSTVDEVLIRKIWFERIPQVINIALIPYENDGMNTIMSVADKIWETMQGSDEQMGDKRPSDFFRTLKSLAGTSGTVDEDLIKKIWFGRIPQVINIALIPYKNDEIDKIMSVADEIWEAIKDSYISVIDHSSRKQVSMITGADNDRICSLEKEISELKGMLSNTCIGINNISFK